MKVRLQEIEFGSNAVEQTKNFYQSIFGMEATVDHQNLTVFTLPTNAIDFNISTHVPAQSMRACFLTDDLQEIMERLTSNSIKFEGPKPSHLGMTSIEFKDPNGNWIRVNQPSQSSPDWLK
ncbi:VOC family protein [Pedobacter insulae]|uniref:Glyoxalase-like domain-containing protein n=1 Tax=Pedobacter insulae TaxID=414048 RepID=A0A1I2VVG9_9SPHI|nr:VOC family protein [Pedobacter insulae]SFG91231.1 Glyoxalase-like domain-containing protein [Pedobacter insulae]